MLQKIVMLVLDELKTLVDGKKLGPEYRKAIYNAIDALNALRRFW